MFYIDYNYAHCIACCMFYHYGNNAMLTFFSLDCGLSRRGNILNFKGAVVCGGLRRALHNARCQLHLSLSDTLRITLLDDFETTIFLFSSRIWKSFVSMQNVDCRYTPGYDLVNNIEIYCEHFWLELNNEQTDNQSTKTQHNLGGLIIIIFISKY